MFTNVYNSSRKIEKYFNYESHTRPREAQSNDALQNFGEKSMDRYEWLTSLYLQINHTRIKRLQAFFRIREVGVTAN